MKRKKRTPQQKITDKCDISWSLLVRQRSGHKCALEGFEKECGGVLQAHHLIGRTDITMRWEPLNGVCLCFVHHIHGVHGTRATEMNHELFRRLPGRMDELNQMRLTRKEANMKVDRYAVLESLKSLLEEAA